MESGRRLDAAACSPAADRGDGGRHPADGGPGAGSLRRGWRCCRDARANAGPLGRGAGARGAGRCNCGLGGVWAVGAVAGAAPGRGHSAGRPAAPGGGRSGRGRRNLLGRRRGGRAAGCAGGARRSGRCRCCAGGVCWPAVPPPCRRMLGGVRVRRRRAALLAGRGLAGALAGRPALLVLRLGGLRQAPAIIQCGGRACAVGRRDDGQHCCGNQKRRSCHAVPRPPDGSVRAHCMIRRISRNKSAHAPAAMPTTRQNYGESAALPRMVRHAPGDLLRAMFRGHISVQSWRRRADAAQTCRSTISLLMSAIALAGLRPLGQALAQFMMVWQRYRRNGSSRSSSRAPVASSRLSLIQR